MKSIFKYIIEPKKGRYNNSTKIGGKEFIINTDIFNFQYISREGVVLATPSAIDSPIKVGTEVIIHHNVFRRWHDIRGNEKNSMAFIEEDKYACSPDQIFMYKDNGAWKGIDGYCFVSPVKNKDKFEIKNEHSQVGILEVGNETLTKLGVNEGDVVGFLPSSEYEFIVDGRLMYRMSVEDICMTLEKNKYKGYQPELPEIF